MSAIVQTFGIDSPQWPAVDPFMFLAHHDDKYPVAEGDTMGPAKATLAGRDIGMDFAGIDGWNMYHGDVVPGFPQHPHTGFETITVVEEGLVDHTDSVGAVARYGRGDTQWLTAGSGVAHAEMFPLVDDQNANPLHLFQIWLNLHPEDRRAEPGFRMFWADETPVVEVRDAEGRRAAVKVIAGSFDGVDALTPPPASYASRPAAHVAVFHAELEPGASVTLPAVADGVIRTLYVYDGTVQADGETLAVQGAATDASQPLTAVAGESGARFMVLQGRPIGAKVVQQGPFVADDQASLIGVIRDYQAGKFGRWPHATDAPVQPRDQGRFARYPDGSVTRPATV